MNHLSRRQFLKTSAVAGLALATSRRTWAASAARVIGANDAVRVGVIGMGGTEVVGGVGGRGHQLIAGLLQVSGNVRIVGLADVDPSFLRREAQPLKERGDDIKTYSDLRRMLEDPSIDAIVVAAPNHWHGLATVWACQAGKDVYTEKPFSHNLWEGRQMVRAARKYNRIVQTGTQNRSSPLFREAFDEIRRGTLGRIRYGHALMYRARDGIGRVTMPPPIPEGLDYDLWCGPSPKVPLRRPQLHYEWHWFWDTGNGEIANNGVHMIDVARWGLDARGAPPRAICLGGRFAVNDAAETANTQVAFLDYQPAPLIVEIRNIHKPGNNASIGEYRGRGRGVVIDCEGGYFAGESTGGALFDRQGKKIRDIQGEQVSRGLDVLHLTNFFKAVRSRQMTDLNCEAEEGHFSAACAHLANISYRIGKSMSPEAIQERVRTQSELADASARCHEHLREHGVNLGATPLTLGPWLTFDTQQERFVKDFADGANALVRREYRKPFVMPEQV